MKSNTFFTEIFRQIVIMLYGGFIYGAVEILYRGHTHPSMFILGGLCLVWVGGLNGFFSRKPPILVQMLIGSAIITLGEFLCGIIVNVQLGMDVWDYSDMPFNICGQVCLLFTVIWFFFSFIAIKTEDFIRERLLP